jgi:hypothetical protein
MNDAQFDRQVREAARRIADGPASQALRARVAAIPAEHPRPARGIRRVTVGVHRAGAAAVLLVLVVAATLVVATLPGHNAVVPAATSPSAVSSGVPSPTSPMTSSAAPVAPTVGWTQVMATGASSALLRDGDTIMSAIPFADGYLLAGNANSGQQAVIWQSPDGVAWQRIDSAPSFASSQITTLVAIPGGVLALGTASRLDSFCGGGAGGNCNPVFPIRLWTSSDGRSWQQLPDATTAVFGRAVLGPVVSGPSGLVLFGQRVPVAPSAAPTPMEWTSTDGRTWQAEPAFTTAFPKGVVLDLIHRSGGFVAVGSDTASGTTRTVGTTWSSVDGRTWTAATVPPTSQEVTRVYADASGLLAMGVTGGSETLWASRDGRSWAAVGPSSLPFATTVTSPMLLSDGTSILAVGADRSGVAGAWISGNGTSWLPVTNDGQVPPIPTAAGGAIGTLGPTGIVLATTTATSTGFSTSVWISVPRGTVSARPTPLASVDVGMPTLAVPSNLLRVAPLSDYPPQVQSGGAPTGPYAYLQGSGAVSLLVADAGGGSVRNVPLPLAAGEQTRQIAADGSWLVVVTAEPGVPCALPTPTRVSWRIRAARLGSDGLPSGDFQAIDAGVATRSFILPGNQGLSCAEPPIPPLALAAGRVAYGVEAPSGTDPAASQVRVRSLADGSLVRSIAAPAQVYAVALSSSAVAWVETANGATSGQQADWRVMEAGLPTGSAAVVPLGETSGAAHPETPGIVLDGNALVASLDQYAATRGTVVRVVGGEVTTLDPGQAQRNCGAVGAQGGLVVLACNGSVIQGDTATATGSWLAVWSPTTGLRAVTGDALPKDLSQVSLVNGWVLWTGTDAAQRPVLAAVPLAALATPGQ